MRGITSHDRPPIKMLGIALQANDPRKLRAGLLEPKPPEITKKKPTSRRLEPAKYRLARRRSSILNKRTVRRLTEITLQYGSRYIPSGIPAAADAFSSTLRLVGCIQFLEAITA